MGLTCNIEVTIHMKNSSERSVERVVESSRVVSGVAFLSHKHLGVGRFRGDGFLEGSVVLEGSSTSPNVERTESTGDGWKGVEVSLSFEKDLDGERLDDGLTLRP